jgi:hypothetical protein
MSQLLQEKPNVFQHDGAPSHIYSEVTTSLNTYLFERWVGEGASPLPGLRDLQNIPPRLFLAGLFERGGLRSTNPYNLEKEDRIRTATGKLDRPSLQNILHEVEKVLICAGKQMENIENFHKEKNN